jgi:hypothetical protein
MKKGKTSRIVGFPQAKISYGTVDSKSLKSIYLNIQSWVTPKEEFESSERLVSDLSKSIKNSVYEMLDRGIFKEKYIVDLDLRTSGITYGKKSFMNLEITFFTNCEIDFKDPKIKFSLKRVCREIYQKNFMKSSIFDFTLTKKVKEV